jgi:hypothetical protein
MSNLTDQQVQAYLSRTTQAFYSIPPLEFLSLTVESPRVWEQIKSAPPSLSRPERDPPILIVKPHSMGGLDVTGHDGRHRAWATHLSGQDDFWVRILHPRNFGYLPRFFVGQFNKGFYVPLDAEHYHPTRINGGQFAG